MPGNQRDHAIAAARMLDTGKKRRLRNPANTNDRIPDFTSAHYLCLSHVNRSGKKMPCASYSRSDATTPAPTLPGSAAPSSVRKEKDRKHHGPAAPFAYHGFSSLIVPRCVRTISSLTHRPNPVPGHPFGRKETRQTPRAVLGRTHPTSITMSATVTSPSAGWRSADYARGASVTRCALFLRSHPAHCRSSLRIPAAYRRQNKACCRSRHTCGGSSFAG